MNTPYRTIVVGLDGSEQSGNAMLHAARRAKQSGGRLVLVHGVYFDSEEFSILPSQIEKRVQKGREVCAEALARLRETVGMEAECVVREGDPSKVIVDVAVEVGADLIVMGTYGRKGLRRMLMGSVTAEVIAGTERDVLAVREVGGNANGHYSSILMAFDGSSSSRQALGRACRVAAADGSQLTIIYVIPKYQEMIGFFETEAMKDGLCSEARRILDEAAVIAAGSGVTAGTTIQEGHVVDRIADTAERVGADLIVMGTHGWRGMDKAILGSAAEGVLVHSPCPVLAVKERSQS